MNTTQTEKTKRATTIGKERDGRERYHEGQCFNCGRQFMSDYDRLFIAGSLATGFAKFCTKPKCETAADALVTA
jgi:hypothetical protein